MIVVGLLTVTPNRDPAKSAELRQKLASVKLLRLGRLEDLVYFLLCCTYVILLMEAGAGDAIILSRSKKQAYLSEQDKYKISVCLVTVNCLTISRWHFAEFDAIVTS